MPLSTISSSVSPIQTLFRPVHAAVNDLFFSFSHPNPVLSRPCRCQRSFLQFLPSKPCSVPSMPLPTISSSVFPTQTLFRPVHAAANDLFFSFSHPNPLPSRPYRCQLSHHPARCQYAYSSHILVGLAVNFKLRILIGEIMFSPKLKIRIKVLPKP